MAFLVVILCGLMIVINAGRYQGGQYSGPLDRYNGLLHPLADIDELEDFENMKDATRIQEVMLETPIEGINDTSRQRRAATGTTAASSDSGCKTQGTSCGDGRGCCRQKYRVQYILVEIDGTDTFVPTMVPNHCYCQNGS